MANELEGTKALYAKLKKLDAAVAGKTLKEAVRNATTPAFKVIQAAVPIGKKEHRTYTGRLVAPGHLSRSLKRFSVMKHGRYVTWTSTMIGVRAEAYYGVQFVELGTAKMTKKPWIVKAFESQRSRMGKRMKLELKRKIEKAAR